MKIHKLPQNKNLCFNGITLTGKGFFLSKEKAKELIQKDSKNHEVIKNLLIGRDLNQRVDQSPSRMVIDFQDWPLEKAMSYKDCFQIVENTVKPVRALNQNKKLRENFWQFSNPFRKQRNLLKPLKKFIATSRVSKYRFFNFIENKNVFPESTTSFFPKENYTFLGILSSKFHVEWTKYNGSSLKGDSRYTNTTCFDTFPLPESTTSFFPKESLTFLGILSSKFHVEWTKYNGSSLEDRLRYTPTTCFETFPFLEKENSLIAETMKKLDFYRKSECLKQNIGLTTLYNQLFENKLPVLKDYHKKLDQAVAELYNFPKEKLQSKREILKFLISLNHEFYENL